MATKKKEVKQEKTRNVAIELWRFLIAVAIIGFHTGWIIARSCDGSLGYYMETTNWFFGSSEVLLVFTLTAGYFMVSQICPRFIHQNLKAKHKAPAKSRLLNTVVV